jgi:hypothetical protein
MLRGAPAGLASLLLLAYRLYLITKMNKDLTLSLGLKILSQAQSCAISLVDKADLAHTTSNNESKFEALLVTGPPNDTAKAETRLHFLVLFLEPRKPCKPFLVGIVI